MWGPNTVPLACTPCGGCVLRGWWGAVPLPGLGLCAPLGRVRGVRVPGGGLGGGGVRRAPRLCARGGAVGRGVALPPSVPLPSRGRQQSRCHWRRSGHGGRGPPYHSSSCSPAFSGRGLCGVLGRWRGLACSPRFLWEPAAGAGGRTLLRLLSRAGGGGTILPAGAGAPAVCGPVGGVGGGVALRPPCSPSGWWPAVPYPGPPLVVGRGFHTVLVGRHALPQGLVRAPLRRANMGSPVSRDPRRSGQLGALGRAVCRSSRIPAPRVAVPSGGGGASPRLRGGGGSLLWPSSWGGGSRRVGGGAAPPPTVLLSRQASACHPLSPACPPGVYSCREGCRAAAGVGRGPVGRQWVSAAGGGRGRGGGAPLPLFATPFYPARPLKGPLRLRRPRRRRSAVGRQGAGRGVRAVHWGRLLWPRCSLIPGAAASSGGGGVRGRPLFGLPLSALGPEGEGEGEWGAPSGPLAPPPDGLGGTAWRSRPLGPAVSWVVALFPRLPLPRVGPSCRPSLGPLVPPSVVARRWQASGGREA